MNVVYKVTKSLKEIISSSEDLPLKIQAENIITEESKKVRWKEHFPLMLWATIYPYFITTALDGDSRHYFYKQCNETVLQNVTNLKSMQGRVGFRL